MSILKFLLKGFFTKNDFTGPDTGILGHTKRYRKVLPTSFRSPYFTEGDIGYFYFKKRRYGSFYLALQTFTRKVFVTRIPNTREASLIAAIAAMKKVLYCMIVF